MNNCKTFFLYTEGEKLKTEVNLLKKKIEELEKQIKNVKFEPKIINNTLQFDVQIGITVVKKQVEIPFVKLSHAVDSANYTLKLFAKVGDKSDTTTIKLPYPPVDISAAVDTNANTLKLFTKVGDKSDTATVELPNSGLPVKLSYAVNNNDYTLKLFAKVGNNSDSIVIPLPSPIVDISAAVDSAQNTLKLFTKVGSNSDTATVKLPFFDPSKVKINLQWEQTTNKLIIFWYYENKPIFNSIVLNMNNFEVNKIITKLTDIDVKVSNNINLSNNIYSFIGQLNASLTNIFSLIKFTETNLINNIKAAAFNLNFNPVFTAVNGIETKLLVAINKLNFNIDLNSIINKITSTEVSLSAKIQSINIDTSSITLNLNKIEANILAKVQLLSSQITGIFTSFNNTFSFISSSVQQTQTSVTNLVDSTNVIDVNIQDLQTITIQEFETITNNVTNINNNLQTVLAGNEEIIEKLDEVEGDCMAMVASDAHLARVDGDQLILRFIPVKDFPYVKTSLWQVQIPYPIKEIFDWCHDFDHIRWFRGEQFAQLDLIHPTSGERIRQPVTGYFASKASADAYFDMILALTKCSEFRRSYPDMTNKKVKPVIQETRIHRAFVSFIQYPEGKAIAKQCYRPVEC